MIEFDFRKNRNGVPILSKKQIEEFAEAILTDYNPQLLNRATSIDIEHFAEYYLGLEMDYATLSKNCSILGMIVFNECSIKVYETEKYHETILHVKEGTILIDASLCEQNQLQRGRFTVGHESSHWILHRYIYQKYKNQISIDFDDKKCIIRCFRRDIENAFRKNIFSTDSDWIEWQADYMSSALLMPKRTFSLAVEKIFKKYGIHQKYVIKGIDNDLDIFIEILPELLAEIFDVSKQAASIRLEKLGFIRDKSSASQISLL